MELNGDLVRRGGVTCALDGITPRVHGHDTGTLACEDDAVRAGAVDAELQCALAPHVAAHAQLEVVRHIGAVGDAETVAHESVCIGHLLIIEVS